MQKKIKTVFFDIGGVLLHIHPDKMGGYWVERSGVDEDMIKKIFPWEAFHKFEKGQVTAGGFYDSFYSALPDGHRISREDFFEGWNRMVGKETATVSTLKTLSRTIPTWLLSNTNPVHIHSRASNYSFLEYTAGEIYSFDVGYRKPEMEIYKAAVEAAGSAPEECLFIDDMEENIHAAKRFGITGIVFTSHEDLELELKKKGLLDA